MMENAARWSFSRHNFVEDAVFQICIPPAAPTPAMASSPSTSDMSPDTLRVALFTGNYNHIADGVSLTLNRLVGYLERVGVHVLVFGPSIEDPPIDHAGTFVEVPSLPFFRRSEYRMSTHFPKAQKVQLEAFQPNLVHIATPDALGLRARSWARRRGLPLVSTYHTHFSSYLSYYRMDALVGALWWYLRWFYKDCEHLYVPTPSMATVLEGQGIQDNVRIWPRGVETHRFHPGKRDLAWRRSLGFADDEVVITYVSRLVVEKGTAVYADAINKLTARGIPHRSLVVGDGPTRADMEAALPNTVFTGYMGGDDLARAYASSDIFLFPSASETFGNVTVEAMASGIPAICANATGSKSLVTHGQTGFLAAPTDADEYAQYAETLVTDGTRRHQMGTAARTWAESLDWEIVLGQMVTYYHEALQQWNDKLIR